MSNYPTPSVFPANVASMAPSGPGAFVAFPSMLGGYEVIVEKAADLGLKWLAPRAGDRGRDQNWTTPKAVRIIAKAKSLGVAVFPWVYSRPDAYTTEIEMMRQFLMEGASGCIIDAEDPWASGANAELRAQKKALAAKYMDSMRRMLPTAFIAHCPYAYPGFHTDFPYAEFGAGCDLVMPQLYWTEFNDAGFMKHYLAASAQWGVFNSANPMSAKPICFIGDTYGSELRGVLHPPPGTMRKEDFDLFLHTAMTKQTCVPVYSLEVAKLDVLADLLDVYGHPTPLPFAPTLPPLPLGQETEAEWNAAQEARDEAANERRETGPNYAMNVGEEPIPESLRARWGEFLFASRRQEMTAWDRKPFYVRDTCAMECRVGLPSSAPPAPTP